MEKHFYGKPNYSRHEILHKPFHDEMIQIAFRKRKNTADRRWRFKGIDYFHVIKILYLIRQKYFFTRFLNFLQYKRYAYKKAIVKYIPPSVQIESSTGCALKCPGCLVGRQNANGHPLKINFSGYDLLQKEIDLIAKKSFQVYFHIHAEPLLNENFFEASRYAVSKGLWTGIHTNFYPNIEHLSEKLIDSKLCNLVVSIDGATQETYEKYRVGGNVEKVFDKIRDLAELKKKRNTVFPWITAKFLVFEHNWHEIKLFKKRAVENGANEVVFLSGFANGIYESGMPCTEYEFNLDLLTWEKVSFPKTCPFLWDDLRIDIEGSLMPCGNGFDDRHKFFKYENQSDNSLMLEQFNAVSFVKMRNYFLGKKHVDDLPEPCRDCEMVKRYN